MPPSIKKVFTWIFWIFVLWAIFTSPNKAADIVVTIYEIIVNGLNAIATFFDRLLTAF